MKNTCIEVSIYSEKLHKLFLDIVREELEAIEVSDISSAQALTIINIGTNSVTIGELTSRGYYTGSNASYNVKKMAANGYLVQEPSERDKRACYIKLSEKGLDLYSKLETGLRKYTNAFKRKDSEEENHLEKCIENMKKIDIIWKSILSE
ncbi:MAG: MarR family transcriptional regulator [Holosporales bacterium]|nr:MarR family transcriptional regulator [Holosporales bacterium]